MKIAVTGSTGNMGQAVIAALRTEDYITEIKLLSHSAERTKKLLRKNRQLKSKIKLIRGSLADADACAALCDGADVVINMGAVIPPKSDRKPQAAVECNEAGANALAEAIEKQANQPALIHISTVALYGNRTARNPFGRVGDPLLVSPFDIYSATKLRGEFRILESGISRWAVLRQTAMLHRNMLNDNIHDGLMFHTCFDAPLEWATAYDSGLLIRNILKKLHEGQVADSFWKRCYNIAGGAVNRSYGIDTLNDGFALIGGSASDFFEPYYNATRNFHGVWYADGDELNGLFNYQTQSVHDYWQELPKVHRILKMGKIAPKKLVRYFAVRRLLKDPNSPAYWYKNNDDARITAYFGGRENYEKLKQVKWSEFKLPPRPDTDCKCENELPVYYGYDFNKPDCDIDLQDLRAVAEAHGGALLTQEFTRGDMYRKLDWQTQDGERFCATAYTVLRAGHWYGQIYRENVWDFDRLCKKDKIFASVWYASHAQDEDFKYWYDAEFKAHAQKIQL